MASFLGQAPRDSRQEQARLRRLKKYGGKQGSDFVYHEPACLHWTCEQVADWIAGDDVGMPKYAVSTVRCSGMMDMIREQSKSLSKPVLAR